MKSIYSLLLTSSISIMISSQITPNSIRFEVQNYNAIDNNGKYYPYDVHGFYENFANGNGQVFILPILKINTDKIKYIGQTGNETVKSDPGVRAIIIPVIKDLSLPNESQKVGLMAAINKNTSLKHFASSVAKGVDGQIIINPLAQSNSDLSNSLKQMVTNYENNVILPQKTLIDQYGRYNTQIISIEELEITVGVGDKIVYNKIFPGSSVIAGNILRTITIENPSVYEKNFIAGGNALINFTYKFRDSKKSTITASFNASKIYDEFIEDSYKNRVTQKSSGTSFLGFGTSKKSMKSSFDQQIAERASSSSISGTKIEMFDADDQMIKQFEDSFLPTISQQTAISNHVAAADKYTKEGNINLADLHKKYAESLQNNDPNLTPDIKNALESLNKNDYIGFIANGARWGNNGASGNTTYRRLLNTSEMTSELQNWSSSKTISLQHSVNQEIPMQVDEIKFRPTLGMINAISYTLQVPFYNGFNIQPTNIPGIITGPVTEGGAFQRSNIFPGTFLTKIGSYSVNSAETATSALSNYSAGDTISLTLIVPGNGNFYVEQIKDVVLGSYPID